MNIRIPGAGPGPNSHSLKGSLVGEGYSSIWDQNKEEIRRPQLGARTREEVLQGGAGAGVCACVVRLGGSCWGPGCAQPHLLETRGMSLPLFGTCFSICQSSPSPLPKAVLPAPEPLTSCSSRGTSHSPLNPVSSQGQVPGKAQDHSAELSWVIVLGCQ